MLDFARFVVMVAWTLILGLPTLVEILWWTALSYWSRPVERPARVEEYSHR